VSRWALKASERDSRLCAFCGRWFSKGEATKGILHMTLRLLLTAFFFAATCVTPLRAGAEEDMLQDGDGRNDAGGDLDGDEDGDDSAASDDGQSAQEKFRDLNSRADEAAEDGDFDAAIALWQAAVPYDRSPYVECRGALQRVYIRVAQHVDEMVARGDLLPGDGFQWFQARSSNLWGNDPCNTP